MEGGLGRAGAGRGWRSVCLWGRRGAAAVAGPAGVPRAPRPLPPEGFDPQPLGDILGGDYALVRAARFVAQAGPGDVGRLLRAGWYPAREALGTGGVPSVDDDEPEAHDDRVDGGDHGDPGGVLRPEPNALHVVAAVDVGDRGKKN